jgi:cytochrome c556
MIPPRAVDQGEWVALSRAMIAASREALSAAIARDTARVFTAGAALYDACTACHAKYATQVMRPNAK